MTTKEIIIHNVSRVLLLSALVATPLVSFGYTRNLSQLVVLAVGYFNQIVYVIIALAVVVFVWNIYNYFFKADVENKKEAGLYVMYSVIGFFIILSFWGLVNIVGNTFNLDNNVPSLNFFRSSINSSGGSSNNGGGSNSTNNNGGGSNSMFSNAQIQLPASYNGGGSNSTNNNGGGSDTFSNAQISLPPGYTQGSTQTIDNGIGVSSPIPGSNLVDPGTGNTDTTPAPTTIDIPGSGSLW